MIKLYPVTYTSRSISSTEKHYSVTKLETLAVVWVHSSTFQGILIWPQCNGDYRSLCCQVYPGQAKFQWEARLMVVEDLWEWSWQDEDHTYIDLDVRILKQMPCHVMPYWTVQVEWTLMNLCYK